MSAPRRHPVTDTVWDWLKNGDGTTLAPTLSAAVRHRLEALDRELYEWDKGRAPALTQAPEVPPKSDSKPGVGGSVPPPAAVSRGLTAEATGARNPGNAA